MVKRKNIWALPGMPNVTKERVLQGYNIEVNRAIKRLTDINLSMLKLKIPVDLPTSGAEALARVNELRKITKENIVVRDNKYRGTIGTPSKYLYIQESLDKVIKGHSWHKDYRQFTSGEANKILEEQALVNKKRKRAGLPEISGLKFEEGMKVQDILKKIKVRGTNEYMNVEKKRFVDNIIQALESAKQMAIESGLYTGLTIVSINKLIDTINNTSLNNNYKKLWRIYKKSNDKELFNMFSSDQVTFQQTKLLDYLMDEYDVHINIDFALDDANF